MRTTPDRIRHAISFELVGLAFVAPLGAWLFDFAMQDISVVAVVSSVIATGWNYVYNLLFDHAMLRLAGHLRKTVLMRVFHSVLFELGLVTVLMPFIAWYLQIGLLHALAMDLSFSLFYLVFAFFFNWAYDIVFPVPGLLGDRTESRSETQAG